MQPAAAIADTGADLGVFAPGFDLLAQACDALADTPLYRARGEELLTALTHLDQMRARLDAQAAKITASCAHHGLHHRQKLRTVAQLRAANTNCDPSIVRRDAGIGRWIIDFAEFSAAFEAGDIAAHHLNVLRRATTKRTHRAMINDQAFLIEFAMKCSFEDFKRAVSRWIDIVNPDGELPKEQLASTRLSITTDPDGVVNIKGTFDPLSGSAIRMAIETAAQRLYLKDQEDDVTRSQGRRRADALTGLVLSGADAGPVKPSALVSIVVSENVAEQLLARLDDPTAEVKLSWNDVDGRCEMIDGTQLHPEYALAVFGVAQFRRIVLNAESRPIDVSYNARRFPDWIRHAARVASRGRCRNPGCDSPYSWLHTDHIDPHSKGGPTSMWNARSCCGPDNLFKSDRIFEDIPYSDAPVGW